MVDWLDERDHYHTQACVEYISKHTQPSLAAQEGQLVVHVAVRRFLLVYPSCCVDRGMSASISTRSAKS